MCSVPIVRRTVQQPLDSRHNGKPCVSLSKLAVRCWQHIPVLLWFRRGIGRTTDCVSMMLVFVLIARFGSLL